MSLVAVSPTLTAALLLSIMAIFSTVTVVEAGLTPPCNCNFGAVDQSTPRCLCACSGSYLLPSCRYTATDIVQVEMWFSYPATDFVSNLVLGELQTQLGIPSESDITFVTAYGNLNKTNARFSMKGNKAQLILGDYLNHAAYLTTSNIESVYDYYIAPAPTLPFAKQYIIYQSSDGRIQVTLETIAWLAGAVVMLTVLLTLERCCFTGAEDEIWEDLQAGKIQGAKIVHSRNGEAVLVAVGPSSSSKDSKGKRAGATSPGPGAGSAAGAGAGKERRTSVKQPAKSIQREQKAAAAAAAGKQQPISLVPSAKPPPPTTGNPLAPPPPPNGGVSKLAPLPPGKAPPPAPPSKTPAPAVVAPGALRGQPSLLPQSKSPVPGSHPSPSGNQAAAEQFLAEQQRQQLIRQRQQQLQQQQHTMQQQQGTAAPAGAGRNHHTPASKAVHQGSDDLFVGSASSFDH